MSLTLCGNPSCTLRANESIEGCAEQIGFLNRHPVVVIGIPTCSRAWGQTDFRATGTECGTLPSNAEIRRATELFDFLAMPLVWSSKIDWNVLRGFIDGKSIHKPKRVVHGKILLHMKILSDLLTLPHRRLPDGRKGCMISTVEHKDEAASMGDAFPARYSPGTETTVGLNYLQPAMISDKSPVLFSAGTELATPPVGPVMLEDKVRPQDDEFCAVRVDNGGPVHVPVPVQLRSA